MSFMVKPIFVYKGVIQLHDEEKTLLQPAEILQIGESTVTLLFSHTAAPQTLADIKKILLGGNNFVSEPLKICKDT